jgi:hypothetical protein
MKKIVFLSIALLFATIVFAQNKKDIVYLKNGSVIIGTIIQEVPYDQIIIKTDEGFILSYKYIDIEKILQSENIP